MINISICDDNPIENAYLSSLVEGWASSRGHSISISNYESAESFLFAYADNMAVDILLLDIQMKEMDGLALARKIRPENNKVQIAFITGFPDYMAEGYDVSALHYLMKPVKEDKLLETLDRAFVNLSKPKKTIVLDTNGESFLVPIDEIIYAEAIDHFLSIFTTEKNLTVKMPLYKLEEKLTTDFLSCHRSYLVNMKFIRKITRVAVILDTGQELPLSRRLYAVVNKAMLEYVKGNLPGKPS